MSVRIVKRCTALVVAVAGATLAACAAQPQPQPAETPGAQVLSTRPPVATRALAPTIAAPDAITTAQLEQRLDPFGNPACKLPCYNGLTPGQGDFQATLDFFRKLGISPVDMIPGDYESAMDGTGRLAASLLRTTDIEQAVQAGYNPPRVDVALQNNQVRSIAVNWPSYPPNLVIAKVMQQMGAPDVIKLALVVNVSPPTFAIELIYAARQSGFLYQGTTHPDAAGLQVCLSDAGISGSLLGIFSPGQTPLADTSLAKLMLPLDGAGGMSGDAFTAAASTVGCLSIPAAKVDQWKALGK